MAGGSFTANERGKGGKNYSFRTYGVDLSAVQGGRSRLVFLGFTGMQTMFHLVQKTRTYLNR